MKKMTVKQYAQHRNISGSMIYRYIDEGKIRHHNLVENSSPKLIYQARADADLDTNLTPGSWDFAAVTRKDDAAILRFARHCEEQGFRGVVRLAKQWNQEEEDDEFLQWLKK